MRYVVVAALVLLSGVSGWWLRGLLDTGPVERSRLSPVPPPAHAPEAPAAEPPSRPPVAPDVQPTPDPDQAVLMPRGEDETPSQHLARILGDDADRAATLLPELLARARKDMDDRRIRRILELMVATGRADLLATVLDAMVSDDRAFDFSHRDDFFRDMLVGVASPEVGEAALRRLRWETSRGQIGPGVISGYAVLLGASRLPQGREFLEEMLGGKFGGDWQSAATAIDGLLASGDPAVLGQVVKRQQLREQQLEVYVRYAGDGSWDAIERLALDPATAPNIAEAAARLSGRRAGPSAAAFVERLWEAGARRPALVGCSALRGNVPEDAAGRLREIVFRAVADTSGSEDRRSAFYAIEYNPLFQTERARALLEGIIANEKNDYWVRAARDSLRTVERTLRRAGAGH